MANEERCVFCGQPVSAFRSTNVQCGDTYQLSCKSCATEMNELGDVDRCRRALLRGLAYRPEHLREQIELSTTAEEHRPKCILCGGKMLFMQEQLLDNSPHYDGILSRGFEILPAYCATCGRFEFFNPAIVRKNRYLKYLRDKDIWDHEA